MPVCPVIQIKNNEVQFDNTVCCRYLCAYENYLLNILKDIEDSAYQKISDFCALNEILREYPKVCVNLQNDVR